MVENGGGDNAAARVPSISGNTDVQIVTPNFNLPYKGKHGEECLRRFQSTLREFLPAQIAPRFTYHSKKLGSYFRVKDAVKTEHQSDLIYGYKPSGETDSKIDYVGETNVRFETRTEQHSSASSSIGKEARIKERSLSMSDFSILDKGYSKTIDRKIDEALYIWELKPILNEQVKCFKMKLFN